MALNQAFAYKSLRAQSVKAALFNNDVVAADGAIVLDQTTRAFRLNLAADKGIEILSNSLGIKLESADALEVGANGLDLKAEIAGDREFLGKVTADTLETVGAATVGGTLTVVGDLVVQGSTTTVESTVVEVADRLIHVNHGTGANDPVPAGLAGVSVHRGAISGSDREHAGFVWDETNAQFIASYLAGDVLGSALLDIKVKDVDAGAAEFSGNVDVAGTFNADGAVTMGSTLGVVGNVDFDAELNVDGDANFGALLTVAGAADLNSTLDVAGKLTLEAGADITGAIMLMAGVTIDNADGNAAAMISFEKDAAELGWGAKNPADVAQALNDLADLIEAGSGALQDEVDAIELAVGLNTDGTFAAFSGSNYLDATTSIKDAAEELDAVVKTLRDDHDALDAALDSFINLIASVAGADNVGISDALAAELGIASGSTAEDALAALDQAIEDEAAARNAMKMQKYRYEITAGDISANVDKVLTIPQYVMGSDAILVFVDGIAEDEPAFYTEVSSTTISLNKNDLVEGMKIMVWIAPFQG
jgi:hypothetical protein